MNNKSDDEILNEVKKLFKFILIERKRRTLKKNEKEYYTPRLWNMDTNFLHILNCFIQHYKKNNEWKKIIVKKEIYKNKNGNDVYKLFDEKYNEIFVCEDGAKAWSTTRQYLQVIMQFKIIPSKEIKPKNITLSFDDTLYIDLTFDSIIKELYEDENNKYFKLKIKSIILYLVQVKYNKYILNFSFSILLSFLKKIGFFDIKTMNYLRNDSDLKFCLIKRVHRPDPRTNTLGYYLDNHFIDVVYEMYEQTYKGIADKFTNDEIIEFLFEINMAFESWDDNEKNINHDEYEINYFDIDQMNYKNIMTSHEIEKTRQNFRKRLIDNRLELKLLASDSKTEKYTEFDNNEESPLEMLDAAHIIPYCILKQTNDDESIEEAKNPYNGLLLEHNIHKYFDKGYITFNLNGEVIRNEEKSNIEVDLIDKWVSMKLKLKDTIFKLVKENIFKYNSNMEKFSTKNSKSS